MSRKPTSPQVATLERIRTGREPNDQDSPVGEVPEVFHSTHQGSDIIAHRSYGLGRTELFRIAPDGFARKV